MSIFPTTVLLATAQRSSPGGTRSQKGTRIVRCTSYRSSTFQNYIRCEPRFRAQLTEGASEIELALV